MFHDGFVNLKKNITVYGHACVPKRYSAQTRARYFLCNWVEKVNAKKIDLIPTSNLNFIKPQRLPPQLSLLAEAQKNEVRFRSVVN